MNDTCYMQSVNDEEEKDGFYQFAQHINNTFPTDKTWSGMEVN